MSDTVQPITWDVEKLMLLKLNYKLENILFYLLKSQLNNNNVAREKLIVINQHL